MARRSDHNREELYELALAAAAHIVEADGFRALTARHVADRIGYSAGTLYNVFANLDDLIVHLNGRTLDELHSQISEISLTGNVSNDVSSLVDIYLKYLETHPSLWAALFDHKLPEGNSLPDWYALKVTKVLSVVEFALSPLFEESDKQALQDTARTLWASLHGISSLSQSGKLEVVTSQTVKQLTSILVENFVVGLRLNKVGEPG